MNNQETLYTSQDAEALTASESSEIWRDFADQMKADLILQYAPNARSLLDIGCGWGQVLLKLSGRSQNLFQSPFESSKYIVLNHMSR